MFLLTGPRNSGNHAVRAMLERLGFRKWPGMVDVRGWEVRWTPNAKAKAKGEWRFWRDERPKLKDGEFLAGHVPPGLIDMPTVVVLRDPRFAAISKYRSRHWRMPFHRWLAVTETFYIATRPFHDLADRADVVLRYENLSDPEHLAPLSEFLGRDVTEGIAALTVSKPDIGRWFGPVEEATFRRRWEACEARKNTAAWGLTNTP